MRSMMDSCLKLSAQDLRLYLFDEAQQPPRLFFVTTSFDSVVEIGYSNILLGYFDCLITAMRIQEDFKYRLHHRLSKFDRSVNSKPFFL